MKSKHDKFIMHKITNNLYMTIYSYIDKMIPYPLIGREISGHSKEIRGKSL